MPAGVASMTLYQRFGETDLGSPDAVAEVPSVLVAIHPS